MAFIQPCFIRKNTPELRKKLEELGYTNIPSGRGIWFLPIEERKYLVTYPLGGVYQGCNGYWYEHNFDCGENEELFLALAALRDDSNKSQWFTNDTCDIWEMSEHELPSHYMQLEGHKATVEEIIEHFNKK